MIHSSCKSLSDLLNIFLFIPLAYAHNIFDELLVTWTVIRQVGNRLIWERLKRVGLALCGMGSIRRQSGRFYGVRVLHLVRTFIVILIESRGRIREPFIGMQKGRIDG